MKIGKPKLFSEHTMQTRNGVMDPFPHLLPYDINPMVRHYVEWDFMPVDQVSHKPQKNGPGCESVGRKGKPTSGIGIYPCEDETLALP